MCSIDKKFLHMFKTKFTSRTKHILLIFPILGIDEMALFYKLIYRSTVVLNTSIRNLDSDGLASCRPVWIRQQQWTRIVQTPG